MWSTFNITNDSGVIKDLDGNILAYGGDSGWIDLKPYLTNNWTEYSTTFEIVYRVVGQTVFMRGLVRGGSDVRIFSNLPSEIAPEIIYLPMAGHSISSVVDGDSTLYLANGVLEASTYSTVWTSIECSYIIG